MTSRCGSLLLLLTCALLMTSSHSEGGSIPVLFAYFCEFLPSSKRAMYLVGLATFWMVGQLIAGGFAWGVIGTVECFYDQNQTLAQNCQAFQASECEQVFLGRRDDPNSVGVEAWRLFTVLAAMPAIFSALLICTLPESPKWLQSVGRDHEAGECPRVNVCHSVTKPKRKRKKLSC